MLKAIIFTEDSDVKLPEIRSWRNSLGKGSNIENNPDVLEVLKKANLNIPGDNTNIEDSYKRALNEYVRPALLMYSGMFGEIRKFYEKLGEILPTELYIVSGRYGLVNKNDEIIPYSAYIKTAEDLEKLNCRTYFVDKMFEATKDKHFIIMCLPKHYLKYLINKGLFNRIGNEHLFFIVTGVNIISKLSSYSNMRLFEKRGVARIGKDYQAKIIETIESEIKSFD